jgi:haloacid dehalogenase-like hydrolase
MATQRRSRHDTIAMIYDFDGTLTPQSMQAYTVFPQLGLNPKRFWRAVRKEARATRGDQMLAYMRMLKDRIEEQKKHISKKDFRALGRRIRYFKGVEQQWFARVERYVGSQGKGIVKLKNYIISAGQKEILEGAKIRDHFARIFASEYYFDHHGRVTFPNVVVNDTIKTQYIFRINKGREDIRESINQHMPDEKRVIPFANMIYFGDGLTDVPGMTVTKKSGGYAIAVFKPGDEKARAVCRELLRANRVDFYAPADYRPDKTLERRVRLILDIIIARIMYRLELMSGRLAG